MSARKIQVLTRPNKVVFRKLSKPRNTSSVSDFKNSQLSESRLQLQPHFQVVTPRSQSLSLLRIKQKEKNQKIRSVLDNQRVNQEKNCMCGECNCGRHFCKLETVKAELNNNRSTSYGREFTKKEAVKSLLVIAKEAPLMRSSSLVTKSKYGNQFKYIAQRPRNEPFIYKDNLKQDGPLINATTYSQEFRHHKGCNQYVKPTNRCVISSFPLNCKTTYSKEYLPKPFKRTQHCRFKDEMAIGNKLWLGQSIYNLEFKNPNPEDYPTVSPLVPKSDKILKSSDFLSRFTTNYRQQFCHKEPSLCPITKRLSEKIKCSPLKQLLFERTQQKLANPNYQTILASKLAYP